MNAETLYHILLAEIEGGKLPVNSPLPTEAALCAKYRLARGTVRSALQRLALEGYVRAGQGRQRIVQQREPLHVARLQIPSKHYPESAIRTRGAVRPAVPQPQRSSSLGECLRAIGQTPSDIVLRTPARVACHALAEEPRLEPATKVSEALEIPPDGKVVWFLRLRLANERPLLLQWAVVPDHLLPDLPDDPHEFLVPGGLTALYEARGIRRLRVRSTYSASRASKLEANYLGLSVGAPLLEERRVSYCAGPSADRNTPYEYLVSLYCDRVSLTFEWLDPPRGPARRTRSGAKGGPAETD